MEIAVKIITVLLCALLKWLGERFNHNFQRFVLPVVLGLSIWYVSGVWGLFLATLPSIGMLCLGYKDYGKNDAVARALWLFVISLFIWTIHLALNYLPWYIYLIEIVGAGWVGTLTRNINNNIGAPINGLWLAWPIFFIH